MRPMRRTVEHAVAGIAEVTGFRLYLQAELARRCAANAQYSLRSFARHLALDHSTLSQLIRGRRPLTGAMIARLGERLGLRPAEIERFVALEGGAESGARTAVRGVRQFARDTAAVLADADHRAILELMRTEEFRPDSRWIARVLNRTVDEVNVLVARLARLRVLEMTDHERWTACVDPAEYGDDDALARFIAARLVERIRELSAAGAPARTVTLHIPHDRLAALLAEFGDGADALALDAASAYRVDITIRPAAEPHQHRPHQPTGDMNDGTARNAVADARKES